MTRPVRCAAILAGGQSSRMGREKALISWHNRPLVAHVAATLKPIFPRICVVTSSPEIAAAAQFPAICDRFPGRGPLGGIHAALAHFQLPTFVVACDMPFLCAELMEWMSRDFEGDALVPRGESGLEPLHAVYAPRCISIFESFLDGEAKTSSMRRVLEEIETSYVPLETARCFDPTLRCFTNWNTPEDLL